MFLLPAALLFLSEACLVSVHSILYEQTMYTVMWMAVKLSSKNHSQPWPMVDDFNSLLLVRLLVFFSHDD